MRATLLTFGVAALLMGCLWIGQGVGFIQWPASSFMLDQRPWDVRGALLAAVGVVLIVMTRRPR